MNQRVTRALIPTLLALAAAGAISCNRGLPSSASKLLSSSSRPGSANAAQDYTKPYLTDDKVQKLIDSMKEEHSPFEVLFKQGGQMNNPMELAGKLEEFNTYARKYGFQDYQDYSAVWGRVVVGEMQLWGQDMQQQSVEMFQKMKSGAQAELNKPNVTPEMKKMYEDQIASAQKGLDDLEKSKSNSGLNDADMALVKKYKDQLDAAEKKYKDGK